MEYGTAPDNLITTTEPISSPMDTTIVNQTYQVTLQGLNPSTVYYIRVAAVFNEIYKRYSEVLPFVTKEQGICVEVEFHTAALDQVYTSPPTTEQSTYLGFLSFGSSSDGTLEACDDCTSSEITLPGDFPFGGYFHQTAYVSS